MSEYSTTLQALGARVDEAEGFIVADLDRMAGHYGALGDEVLQALQGAHSFVARDVAFADDGARRLRSAQVRLQAEIALDSSRAAGIESDLSTLAQSNSASELLDALRRLGTSLPQRLAYLECARTTADVDEPPSSPRALSPSRRGDESEPGGRTRSRSRVGDLRRIPRARTQLTLPHSMRVLVEAYGGAGPQTFLGAINDIRTRVRQEILEVGAGFYHDLQRGVPRTLTLPTMKDTIHGYAEAVQESLAAMLREAQTHRAAAAAVVVQQAGRAGTLAQRVVTLLFDSIVQEHWATLSQVAQKHSHA